MTHGVLERVWLNDAPRMRSQLRRQYGHDAAEDLVAEAITRLAEEDDVEYDAARNLFGRITLNAASDYTELSRHADVPLSEADEGELGELGGSAPFPTLDLAMMRADFDAALRRLPEPEREAFILTELRGLTVREAGGILEVHHTTIVRRAEAARTYLRKELA